MKKIFAFVITMLLGAAMCLGQTGAGAGKSKDALNPQPLPPGRTATVKTAKTSKAHKGGKKSKKGNSANTTPAPK